LGNFLASGYAGRLGVSKDTTLLWIGGSLTREAINTAKRFTNPNKVPSNLGIVIIAKWA
jgi:hypothetical protein